MSPAPCQATATLPLQNQCTHTFHWSSPWFLIIRAEEGHPKPKNQFICTRRTIGRGDIGNTSWAVWFGSGNTKQLMPSMSKLDFDADCSEHLYPNSSPLNAIQTLTYRQCAPKAQHPNGHTWVIPIHQIVQQHEPWNSSSLLCLDTRSSSSFTLTAG